jgi:hypothetical protein
VSLEALPSLLTPDWELPSLLTPARELPSLLTPAKGGKSLLPPAGVLSLLIKDLTKIHIHTSMYIVHTYVVRYLHPFSKVEKRF